MENKKIKIQIKNRWTENVIFEYEKENNTIKDTVKEAIRQNINLSYSDLSYSDLSDSDLSYSNLSYSNLRGSNLRGSNLRGSNLSYSDLSYSDLSYSNLSYSNLRGSNLRGSYIYYDDIEFGVEKIINDFENEYNIKIKDYNVNHYIFPTKYDDFWNYGLIIKDYEIVENKEVQQKEFDIENATENEKFLYEEINKLRK